MLSIFQDQEGLQSHYIEFSENDAHFRRFRKIRSEHPCKREEKCRFAKEEKRVEKCRFLL